MDAEFKIDSIAWLAIDIVQRLAERICHFRWKGLLVAVAFPGDRARIRLVSRCVAVAGETKPMATSDKCVTDPYCTGQRLTDNYAKDKCISLVTADYSSANYPSGGQYQSVERIFELIISELKQSTRASEPNCREIANRITAEVSRICSESKRIQASGEVDSWSTTLARHRLKQCLKYYQLGSHRGRVELHSTLSAVVYRYITPPQVQSSYQARLTLIEDFLQGFYIEALNAFRRENQLPSTYCPRSLLELAEYMAFTERYGKRRIPLPGRRSQQLIILRAQTFSQQQPPETMVDIEQAAEGSSDADSRSAIPMPQVREQMMAMEPELPEDALRNTVISELMSYLEERQQQDCADYFALRLRDLPANEIEEILGLTARQRDYLQQRFKYHLIRFALSHHWELVHQWLEADLERNFGLTPQQWQVLQERITPQQRELLNLKQTGAPDGAIAQSLSTTPNQVQKQWSKLLEQAWEIRNSLVSGASNYTDESSIK